jgi:monofunctional biosynthetic peptidoglycan transglycosylase
MPSRKGPTRWRRLALAAAVCAAVLTGVFWASLPSAETLRSGNPSSTALIDARAREARRKGRPARRNQHWAALKNISPWLRDAVVNSEDARFYEHQGVDPVEMRAALAQAVEEGRGRGASTLNQQLAKNLWLGEERSLLRKLKEVVLARRLEALGKDRVLELYLNVAEWGNGVYGADAAARVWFHKPAAELLPEEAAVLAAMLPAPRKRNPEKPSSQLRKRSRRILELYGVYGQLAPADLALARERLRGLLGS